jgi:hypothetical protein
VRLRIISVCIKKYQQAFVAPLPGNGCCIISEPSSPVYPCFYLPFQKTFLFSPWSNIPFKTLFAPKDKFLEPLPSKPITASGYELCLGFIAMVQEQTLSC